MKYLIKGINYMGYCVVEYLQNKDDVSEKIFLILSSKNIRNVVVQEFRGGIR